MDLLLLSLITSSLTIFIFVVIITFSTLFLGNRQRKIFIEIFRPYPTWLKKTWQQVFSPVAVKFRETKRSIYFFLILNHFSIYVLCFYFPWDLEQFLTFELFEFI